jgi:hypothetical protein
VAVYDVPPGVIWSLAYKVSENAPDVTVTVCVQPDNVTLPEYSGCARAGEFSDTVTVPPKVPPKGVVIVSLMVAVCAKAEAARRNGSRVFMWLACN